VDFERFRHAIGGSVPKVGPLEAANPSPLQEVAPG